MSAQRDDDRLTPAEMKADLGASYGEALRAIRERSVVGTVTERVVSEGPLPQKLPFLGRRLDDIRPDLIGSDPGYPPICFQGIKGKCGPETDDPAAQREAVPAGVRSPAPSRLGLGVPAVERVVPRYPSTKET